MFQWITTTATNNKKQQQATEDSAPEGAKQLRWRDSNKGSQQQRQEFHEEVYEKLQKAKSKMSNSSAAEQLQQEQKTNNPVTKILKKQQQLASNHSRQSAVLSNNNSSPLILKRSEVKKKSIDRLLVQPTKTTNHSFNRLIKDARFTIQVSKLGGEGGEKQENIHKTPNKQEKQQVSGGREVMNQFDMIKQKYGIAEAIMEEEKTPNPKQGEGGSIPMHSSNKNEVSILKDSSLPVLKLRRRIERIESDQHPNIQPTSFKQSTGPNDNQSLSQAPPIHRNNDPLLQRRMTLNLKPLTRKKFTEDSNSASSDKKFLAPHLKLRVSQVSISNGNSPENQRKLLMRLLADKQGSGGGTISPLSNNSQNKIQQQMI